MTAKQNAETGPNDFDLSREMRAELLEKHPGQFALFCDGFVGVFPTRYKAGRYADKHFPNGWPLLVELADRPVIFPGIYVAPKPDNSEGTTGAEG